MIQDFRRPVERTHIVAGYLENRSIESDRRLLVIDDEDESPGLRQLERVVGGLDETVER
ncbi:MAG: hypothetical protein OXU33_05880 [Gemmatimonadota bacterium]|nr:hypothetical protein [Gemmatimonadota bacterium]MDE3013583.1 hypothetical protein [Gemmatimonadota bacterium]